MDDERIIPGNVMASWAPRRGMVSLIIGRLQFFLPRSMALALLEKLAAALRVGEAEHPAQTGRPD